MKMSTSQRFWRAVFIPDNPNDCWIWEGEITPKGYGRFEIVTHPKEQRRRMKAHRYCYELVKGPIPPGMEIDHLCRNAFCVHPEHLEVVTPDENLRRQFYTPLSTPPPS